MLQNGSRQLNCLIETESTVIPLIVGHDRLVSQLKKDIQGEAAPLKHEHPYNLQLYKVDIDLKTHSRQSLSQIRVGNHEELASWVPVLKHWTDRPPFFNHLHIIVKVSPIIDISQKLFDLWAAPVELNLEALRRYLEEPLDPEWKIPLSHFEWKNLLIGRGLDACRDQDLEPLFKECEDETANEILDHLKGTLIHGPLDPGGTEQSLIEFWDANIRRILVYCLDAESIRNNNQGTETGRFQPDFGLLLSRVCVFRGAEKRQFYHGNHPKDGLRHKTQWVYDPAPYILGYYAIGVNVNLAAILQQDDGNVQVVDIVTADLSSRCERIKNTSRMIKLCGILRWLQQIIGEGKDKDMFLLLRGGGKSIQFCRSHVRKRYGIRGKAGGKERVEHLQAIYASLASKDVPNVDRLKKAKVPDSVDGSYIDLEPQGISEHPTSPTDVRNAVVCILEALKVAHADPPVFHRDIRWPNIMKSREESSKWFLIDWEDASFAPTKAALRLTRSEHSPKVYEDNHGAEVDIWAVGRLIFTAHVRNPALESIGQRMMDGNVLNAEQGLQEIRDLPQF